MPPLRVTNASSIAHFNRAGIVPWAKAHEDNWHSASRDVGKGQEFLCDSSLSRKTDWLFSGSRGPDGRRPRVREFHPAAGPAILSKQKTVFVVDDDPGMLRGVKRLLRAHGY